MLRISTINWGKKMSEQNDNTKIISEQLKKLNSNFNTFNKIMSSFLVIATTESTFKNKMIYLLGSINVVIWGYLVIALLQTL